MTEHFVKGQRWVSSMEPELGLGVVESITDGRITLQFPAHEEARTYTAIGAPLKRVRFSKGEIISKGDGTRFAIHEVKEKRHLFHYFGADGQEASESELADNLSFSKPHDRLLSGQADPMELFELRHECLRFQYEIARSPWRGFQGARIELIPHQLYVAQEVAERYAPRVLLADEVGLGKTIEAGLILQRLVLSGRVRRALILVPETLLHQWFVELLRRFQLAFSLFDEERCQSIEAEEEHRGAEEGLNPFLDEQFILCATSFLVDNPARAAQVLDAPWDLLIVDEAHHLEWSSEEVSPEYRLVENLAGRVRRLILLTATPEQLGREGHFARLRLLDPERYADLDQFLEQTAHYTEIARLADGLLGRFEMSNKDWQQLKRLFSHYTADESADLIEGAAMEDRDSRRRLLDDLLDQYGTGRVMFRNRRRSMEGFPHRRVTLIPLKPTKGLAHVEWLAGYLRNLKPDEKVLLICATRERVEAVEEALRNLTGLKMAVFHEDMTLMQRDRNAAFFAEEDGAQILICSEIGSEGRNFQFAHRLVLFDLPADPAMLEQRIGRLDRIGQTETIQILVPYLQKSGEEMIVRWYHEGLDAFETCQQAGHRYWKTFGPTLAQLMHKADVSGRFEKKRFEKLLAETKAFHAQTVQELESGRDHLLELNSFRERPAAKLVDGIRGADGDLRLEKFFLRILDYFGVTVEELQPRVYLLKPEHLFTDSFPGLPAEGTTVTLDRHLALHREEMQFLTWDHPMVGGAIDLLLGSETGNCSFAYIEATGPKMLFLEAIYVLECVAPTDLHADRFFPATPIRVLVSHRGEDYTETIPTDELGEFLRPGKPQWIQKNMSVLQDLLPKLQKHAENRATDTVAKIVGENRNGMRKKLEAEIVRLKHLRSINDHVREEEVILAQRALNQLDAAMDAARLRLDSMRLLFKGDE